MHVRWIAASLFVAFASPAFAQSPAVLGKGDGAFAQALYQRGYADLAEKLCDLIEKSGQVAADEAVMIKALHLDLRLDLAMRESDLAKRKDTLSEILKEKEDFVEQYGSRKEGIEASNTLPDVYQKLGDTVLAAMQREKDLTAKTKLQDDGKKIYAQAVEKLKQRLAELEDGKEDPAKQDRYINTLFNLPKTLYFYALLYPEDDKFNRDEKLNAAVDGFQVLGLDYGDLPIAYEGTIYMGLAYKELGNIPEAIGCFDDVIGIREKFYEPDSKGEFPLAPLEADLVSFGVLQKMLLLAEQKNHQAAIDEGDKFLKTTPDPLETKNGLPIVAQKADSHLALGDTKGAGEAAERLVEVDPRGAWGAKGREIQGRLIGGGGGSLDPEKTLKIAQTFNDRGDKDRALQIAQQALDATRGHAKEADLAIDTYMFMGAIHLDRGGLHEAALVFDTAAERFPNAEKAPEAVYQALQRYLALNRDDKRPYWKKRIDERMKTLVTRYPNSSRSAGAQLVEAQQQEDDKNWVAAAELYTKVQPSSSVYLEAQYKAGRAYFRHANSLYVQSKAAEAKPVADQARTLLESAIQRIDAERDKTVNLETKTRLDNWAIGARTELAQLFLTKGYDQPDALLRLLEKTDERFAANQDAIANFWGFRIQALQALGRFDEAVSMLDGLAKKDADSKAIGPAAFLVARALDARATELRDKEKKPADADAMQRRAATYYQMAGRAILRSDNPKVAQVEAVGNRLFALGLDVNEVPPDRSSFVGWKQSLKDPALWQIASDLFDAALRISPNYKMQVSQARVYGFLGQFDKAAAVYGSIFDQDKLFDDQSKLNRNLLRSKPELLMAYLESGVAEHHVAAQEQSQDRHRLAFLIFDQLLKNKVFEENTFNWWWCTFYGLRSLVDMGNYEQAGVTMRELKRSTQGFGEAFGVKAEFDKLEADLAQKK